MHDGSMVRLRKVSPDYDPTRPPARVTSTCSSTASGARSRRACCSSNKRAGDMHDINGTTDVPLARVPFEKLCPGKAALDELQSAFRWLGPREAREPNYNSVRSRKPRLRRGATSRSDGNLLRSGRCIAGHCVQSIP